MVFTWQVKSVSFPFLMLHPTVFTEALLDPCQNIVSVFSEAQLKGHGHLMLVFDHSPYIQRFLLIL